MKGHKDQKNAFFVRLRRSFCQPPTKETFMHRLLATIRCDLRLQQRNGFYYATAFVVAVYALGLSQLHASGARLNLAGLLPAVVLNNLMITSFYFIGALVLLEKTEGTLT